MLIALAVYLRDPPWAGNITSGMRASEGIPPGTRFRWTAGRASFLSSIPNATTMTLPMAVSSPARMDSWLSSPVSVDDRWLANVELPDPNAWVKPSLPLPRRGSSRRFRRIKYSRQSDGDRRVYSWSDDR